MIQMSEYYLIITIVHAMLSQGQCNLKAEDTQRVLAGSLIPAGLSVSCQTSYRFQRKDRQRILSFLEKLTSKDASCCRERYSYEITCLFIFFFSFFQNSVFFDFLRLPPEIVLINSWVDDLYGIFAGFQSYPVNNQSKLLNT